MIGYAAICAGLALTATCLTASSLARAVAIAAMICAVGALFVLMLSLGDY